MSDRVSDVIGESFELIEQAQITLADKLGGYEAALPNPSRSVC